MRPLLTLSLIIAMAGSALAYDLGPTRNLDKIPAHNQPIHVPDGRDGGNDAASAVVIATLPFEDTGNTFGKGDDWDEVCPYLGSTSEDAWYSFTPATDTAIDVDLCGSGYDTKTYVLDSSFYPVGCNDDFYFDETCGVYVSYLENVLCPAGDTYYIVVDGYGGETGPYNLLVTYGDIPPEPCDLTCAGEPEGEPPLMNGYVDVTNSGCGSPEPGGSFQTLQGTGGEMLSFCGKSGWYLGDGLEYRDTDWFIAVIGETGTLEWTLDAEYPLYGFLLEPQDCAEAYPVVTMEAGPCNPVSMTITGNPGDPVWLWTGPTAFSAPVGFEGHEFDYVCTFTGIEDGIIAVENASWGAVKSLYR